ncbi:MAG TPA: hypothetical protein VF629_13640 [Hymenobacter sp.]|uniref:hypothetical protein n=1 Tax=Hymenobacter sp. TaxID=1898978 RepID=UPI002EDAE7FE
MLLVLLWLGMGRPPEPPTGPFGPATTYAVGRQPRALALAYANGYGRPDLVVLDRNLSRVSVLLGQ